MAVQVADIEKAEKEKMRAKVENIISQGLNCFVNRQLIYNFPEEIFADAGVMAIEHADFDGIERLALVTGQLCCELCYLLRLRRQCLVLGMSCCEHAVSTQNIMSNVLSGSVWRSMVAADLYMWHAFWALTLCCVLACSMTYQVQTTQMMQTFMIVSVNHCGTGCGTSRSVKNQQWTADLVCGCRW